MGLETDPVRWRDGIYIDGTSIWCDARRSRDMCFVSAADQMARARHGQLISTHETALMMDGGSDGQSTSLGTPYGRPFTLGTTRMELFRSGYGLGAASIRVDVFGKKLIYAGRIQTNGMTLGGQTEFRKGDVLTLSARYAHMVLPDPKQTLDRLFTFCRNVNGKGGTAILIVRSFLQGLDLLSLLSEQNEFDLRAHFSLIDRVKRVSSVKTLPLPKPVSKDEAAPHVLIWPMRRRGKLDAIQFPKESKFALVSGMANEEIECTRLRVDEGFPWPDEADGPALKAYMESTGAKEIYWTDANERILDHLKDFPMVSRIGPPIQMNLFSQGPSRRQTDRIA